MHGKEFNMARYYFTYGSESHPFFGGWTEVEAEDRDTACAAFRAFHPDKVPGRPDCCEVYDEARFKQTPMYGPGGNLGHRCHEVIMLQREIAKG